MFRRLGRTWSAARTFRSSGSGIRGPAVSGGGPSPTSWSTATGGRATLDDPASGRPEDRLRHTLAFLTAAYDDYRAVLGEITGDADAALRGRFVARQAVVEDLRRRVDGAGDAKQLRDVVLAIAADLAETSGDPS